MTFTNQPYTSVAFSGYRTSKILHSSSDSQIISSIENKLLYTIETLYHRGARLFISGGSTGFDTLAAFAVLKSKSTRCDISLTLALPFEGHDAQFSPRQKANFRTIANGADQIIYVSQQYHDRAYLDRNKYMLRNSSTLVCYFDGQRGGTMYTTNRALNMGHEIINLCEGYQIKRNDTQLLLF
ncbi:MAG: SLOG family protein [Rikenellaceae bacterium]